MRERLLLLVFVFLSFSSWTQAQIPAPPAAPEGRVNDFAGVIFLEYKEKISSLIQEVDQKTSAEIAVVTQSSIAPYGADQYAQMLFDSWKVGKKGRDNGVLILLAVKEREWRIHTGYGVEGILPDGVCGQIGRDYMVQYFKEGKYSEGLYYGAAAVANIIAKDANVTLDGLKDVSFQEKSSDVSAFWYIFIALIILILMFRQPLIWIPGGFGGYGRGGFGGGSLGGGGFGGFGGGFSGGGGAGGRF